MRNDWRGVCDAYYEAWNHHAAADETWLAAWARYETDRPPAPMEARYFPAQDGEEGKALVPFDQDEEAIRAEARWRGTPPSALATTLMAWRRWNGECEALRCERGIPQLNARRDEAARRKDAAYQRLLETAPPDLSAFVEKIEAMSRHWADGELAILAKDARRVASNVETADRFADSAIMHLERALYARG